MSRWQELHSENADVIEEFPQERIRRFIVLASAIALYLEMVMIRWHSTSSHVFAIFKNVSLLSCFLGLGIGFALSTRRRPVSLGTFLPLLAVQTALFSLIATTIGGRRVNPVAEQLVMGLQEENWSWLHMLEGNAFLAAIFVLNATMFIPWGYTTGRLMSRLPPIESYSWNLLGSVLGIVVFFLLSMVWAPPSVWIGLVLIAAVPFLIGSKRMMKLGIISSGVIIISLGLVGRLEERRYYSPYQLITLRLPKAENREAEPTLKVNSAFFQTIIDCSPEYVAFHPEAEKSAQYYDLPYRFRKEPGDVLIVGAGTGNDVAAALRSNATSVTAVEIDPAIVYLGKRLHPERPYQDPRTRIVITDARTFLRQTDDKFDMIIYGLLDSHTNLGAMTNVRLDSFVYTLEGFQEAITCLNPNGLLVVTYHTLADSQVTKLYRMLEEAYTESKPAVYATLGGMTYVTGPGAQQVSEAPDYVTDQSEEIALLSSGGEIATDDWPYFYMKERTYPITYAVMIVILLLFSGWLIRRRVGTLGPLSARRGTFFFLGAGFMLIETKVITELGLVFGNTWLVVGIAITGVLVMGYLANLWIWKRGPVPLTPTFVFLGGAILLGLAMSRLWPGNAFFSSKLVAPVLLTLPLFFAGLIFSSCLSKTGGIGDALSANLFGAMLGGFLEYNSMYWGLSSLYPLGIAIYALAFGCALLAKPSPEQTKDQTLLVDEVRA